NVQVSWVKLNKLLSQLCLHAGANDYGGTLMEENISREAGATAGQYTSPQEFQSLILEVGRIPAERNTTYSRINIRVPGDQLIFEQALEPEFAYPGAGNEPLYCGARWHRAGRFRPRSPLGESGGDGHYWIS